MKFEKIGFDESTGRELYYVFLRSTEELSTIASFPDGYFVLLFLNYSADFNTDSIAEAARRFTENGLAYLCAWGNRCEQIHDIFDEAICSGFPNETDDKVIMTTWHRGDSIDDVLWFSIYSTWPADHYFDWCKKVLVLNCGDGNLEAHILHRLRDPKKLAAEACRGIS